MPTEKRGGSVLLVEDDPDYCQLLNEAFVEAGFHTIIANNGERALEILRTQTVDLVVSDFVMPEVNGLELCRLMNEDPHLEKLKVILYSCNTDQLFRSKARELGALDYLPKTDDTGSLVQQVCNLAGMVGQPSIAVLPPQLVESTDQGRLRAVASQTVQLKALVGSLLDFARIVALSGDLSPAAKLAWEATERTGLDIRRVLEEMNELTAVGRLP
jgi:DNA-binding response OmpR family regulator